MKISDNQIHYYLSRMQELSNEFLRKITFSTILRLDYQNCWELLIKVNTRRSAEGNWIEKGSISWDLTHINPHDLRFKQVLLFRRILGQTSRRTLGFDRLALFVSAFLTLG